MVEYTGLSLGEKLYEEKLMAEEGLRKTDNDLIYFGCPFRFDEDAFLTILGVLTDAAYANDDQRILALVMRVVSAYHPEGVGNKDATYRHLAKESK